MRLFSRLGEYEACGVFSVGHFVLLIFSFVGIYISLKLSKNKTKEDMKGIINLSTTLLWVLEIIKISFNIFTGNADNPNSYIPLYYCSLILYAGPLSIFGKGVLKRVGDIFLATGAIVAGLSFLILPITSLTNYPAFHFISIQSFILHSLMVYTGVMVNKTKYVEYNKEDFKYYFWFICIFGAIAHAVNLKLGTNLMFITQNFPNTPIDFIYTNTGVLFPVVMIILQATLPFYIIMFFKNKLKGKIDE